MYFIKANCKLINRINLTTTNYCFIIIITRSKSKLYYVVVTFWNRNLSIKRLTRRSMRLISFIYMGNKDTYIAHIAGWVYWTSLLCRDQSDLFYLRCYTKVWKLYSRQNICEGCRVCAAEHYPTLCKCLLPQIGG